LTGPTRWPPRPQHRCVGVLFGGPSAEHEVSCSSALAVLRALPCDRFRPVAIGIDREGGFVLIDDDEVERLRWQQAGARAIDDRLNVDGRPVRLQSRPGTRCAEVVSADGRGEPLAALDVVFPLLHGSFGEDGVIQGLLETLFVPYVGCGILASAVGMDKVAMKRAFLAERIPITPHVWFDEPRWRAPGGGVRLVDSLRWPLFVKPANMGSSIGISRVSSEEELHVAVEQALRWGDVVLVEQGVRGRELECGVLGGAEPEASVVGEVSVMGGWFDYQQKYFSVADPMIVPAPLDTAVADEIRELSVRAFRAIGGWGLARADFLYDEEAGELYVNELNTMPGFTAHSMYPKVWAAAGIPYADLIQRLIELAFARQARDQRRPAAGVTP
jgi:D-alanine-D-alanine ligase